MARFLWALVFCLALPAVGHPGDHAFVRIEVRGPEVVAEMDLPSHVLISLDRDGDLLISAQELSGGGTFLQRGFRLSSGGLAVAPRRFELVPPPAWSRAPSDPIERANFFATIRLAYRFPQPVRGLEVRFDLFPLAPTADCQLRLNGLGPVLRVKLQRGQTTARFGQPAFPRRAPLDLPAILSLAALVAARRGELAFILAYVAVLAGKLTVLALPPPPPLALIALALTALQLLRGRPPLAILTGGGLAWQHAAWWQLASWSAAGWYGLGLALAGGIGVLLGLLLRQAPVLAGPTALAALAALWLSS